MKPALNTQNFLLKNGLKVVYSYQDSPVAHCGLMVEAGSRDEQKGQEGLAHFIEHLLFKGTEKRKAWQVLTRLEMVGGELNAFTTKEETCVHASFLSENTERAIELIADIIFNSVFPEKEIEKEKDVVLDEINAYQDNPMEQIYDDFESMVFQGQPLGNPILGTPVTVKGFSRSDLVKFVRQKYLTNKMVFSYVGNQSPETIKNFCNTYLEGQGKSTKVSTRGLRIKNHRRRLVQPRKTFQAHYITGNIAYSSHSVKRFQLYLMNNILGGPGMNSRLNMNIREKYGYTYQIESSYVPFRDSGLFNVYLATEKKYLEKTISLVEAEFRKLKNEKISPLLLSRYKNQLKGQLAISQENKAGIMLNNAKSMLNYNKPVSLPEVFQCIENVTASQLMDVANEILKPSGISSLLFDPVAN
jgi:predicted Zn-dependent peptidase